MTYFFFFYFFFFYVCVFFVYFFFFYVFFFFVVPFRLLGVGFQQQPFSVLYPILGQPFNLW
jgi:hypothetical protein